MKVHFSAVSLLMPLVVISAPLVDPASVTYEQDASGRVTIAYSLTGERGIVTIDVQTNTLADASGTWATIGDRHLTTMCGAVNRLVEPQESAHMAYWFPRVDWPEAGGVLPSVRVVVTARAENNPPDYMVVELAAKNVRRYYTSAEALPCGGLTNSMYFTERLVMRRIPAAGRTFRMGPSPLETRTYPSASSGVPHLVSFTNDYFMSVCFFTQGQCLTLTNLSDIVVWNVSGANSELNPLFVAKLVKIRGAMEAGEAYDWPTSGHAVSPVSLLGILRAQTGIDFDLPTEAQWEYACRAGTDTMWNNRSDSATGLGEISWFSGAPPNLSKVNGTVSWTGSDVNPVGLKKPNAWGLYDMHGFLWEVCLDWYSPVNDPGDGRVVIDPEGPSTGTQRVGKGGSWSQNAVDTRSASRTGRGFGESNYAGFRFVCPVGLKW